jgi:predicted flap endonuclease-1-like 5' DNA nuclease
MDSILGLALLFSGTFLGVCLTALFYLLNIRPRLLGETGEETEGWVEPSRTRHIGGGGGAEHLEALHRLEDRLAVLEGHLENLSLAPSGPAGPSSTAPVAPLAAPAFQEELWALAKQVREHLEAQDEALRSLQNQLDLNTSLAAHANAILDDLDADIDILKTQGPRVIRTRPVRLTDIKGVGPVFAAYLYEAGIENYEQLAALTPEELRNLIQVPEWRKIDAEGWIEQARLLASQEDKLEAYS